MAFLKHRLAVFGAILFLSLTGVALAAPILPLADPNTTDLAHRFLPLFSQEHLLGTDHLGRDMLARLVWGTRASLAVGAFATLIAAFAGTLIGLVAGYWGRWLDAVLMRGIDVLMAFPYLLLALAIVAALGPGLRNAMIAISVANVPFFARTVRGVVLGLKERAFIDAARLAGFGHTRILGLELLPNTLPAIIIMMATTLGWMILETAGLSFLGLGAQPPDADLGSMLGNSREFLTTVPRVAALPGLVILALVIGINLFADGLRDQLDPKLRHEPSRIPRRDSPQPPRDIPQPARESDEAPLLAVKGLGVRFFTEDAALPAVDDVSFTIAAGERVGLVGESGCGKTQTALAVLGLIPQPGQVVAGAIRFQGKNLIETPEKCRRALRGNRIAYIPQDPVGALDPLFPVGDQIVEILRCHQGLSRNRARRRGIELLGQVGIAQADARFDAYPHEFSGGMRQRVLIAMALANDPDLMIADEATTALDVTIQKQILKLLDALCREREMALLFITHDLGIVSQLCQRVLVMYSGRVVEATSTLALFERPRHPYSRALLECAPVLGQPEKSLVPIPGQPPPLDALPPGCHFASRCSFAEPQCRQDPMRLRRLENAREVRCVRAEEVT